MALLDIRTEPAAKGYETPTYDDLKPQWKLFVDVYVKTSDSHYAALAAGYVPRYALERGFILSRRPNIVKAIEELANRRLRAAEQTRPEVIARLLAESKVSITDLTKWDADQQKLIPRSPEEIDDPYRCCMGLITVTREGNAVLNNTAQNNVRKLLASYMKWDREAAETNAPINFNFGELKPQLADDTESAKLVDGAPQQKASFSVEGIEEDKEEWE